MVLDKEDASLDRPDGADSDPEEHPEADLFHDFIYEEEPVPLTYEETRGKTTFVHHKESKQLLGKITYWMGGISCVCHIPEHKKKCKNFVIAPHDFLNVNIFSEWLMAGYGKEDHGTFVADFREECSKKKTTEAPASSSGQR